MAIIVENGGSGCSGKSEVTKKKLVKRKKRYEKVKINVPNAQETLYDVSWSWAYSSLYFEAPVNDHK